MQTQLSLDLLLAPLSCCHLIAHRPMTAPQMSRCDQGHKGGTTANHAMSGGVNTRSEL